MKVTLNDIGLTLALLCSYLLTRAGPNWAYKQQVHTSLMLLSPTPLGQYVFLALARNTFIAIALAFNALPRSPEIYISGT